MSRLYNQIDFVKEEFKSEIKEEINFPLEIFPKFIQNYINEFYETSNFSIDFSSVAFLSLMGTLAGNNNLIQIKNSWVTPPIFWFAVVAGSGSLKTHPVKNMLKPLIKIDKAIKKEYDIEMERYEINEELKENQKDKTIKKPKFKQTVVNDATLESIFRIHEINSKGLLFYKDELIGWFNQMGQYKTGGKGADMEFWLESFNNGDYIVNRVNSEPISIENININIIGTIQPSKLNKIPKDNGLLQRFLFTKNYNTIQSISLEDVDIDLITEFSNKIINHNQFFNTFKEPQMYHLTDEAKIEFQNIDKWIVSKQLCANTSPVMMEYYEKLKTYSPRFALIIQIIDGMFGPDDYVNYIDTIHFEKAFKLIKYFASTAELIFEDNKKEEEIAEISKANFGLSTAEKAQQLFKKGFKNIEIAKALDISKGRVSQILNKKV